MAIETSLFWCIDTIPFQEYNAILELSFRYFIFHIVVSAGALVLFFRDRNITIHYTDTHTHTLAQT